MLYDASEDEALGHSVRAPEPRPDSETIVPECAIGLLALDDGSEHVRNLPVRGIGMDSGEAAEDLRHAEAIERLEAPDWSADPLAVNPLICNNHIDPGWRQDPDGWSGDLR